MLLMPTEIRGEIRDAGRFLDYEEKGKIIHGNRSHASSWSIAIRGSAQEIHVHMYFIFYPSIHDILDFMLIECIPPSVASNIQKDVGDHSFRLRYDFPEPNANRSLYKLQEETANIRSFIGGLITAHIRRRETAASLSA